MPDKNRPPVFISGDKILTIEFRRDGFMYLKDRRIEMPEIREELVRWNMESQGEAVLLKISGELPYEKAVILIDAVKASGDSRFSVRMI